MKRWLTRGMLLILLSTFFADAGYQALIAVSGISCTLSLGTCILFVANLTLGFLYIAGPLYTYGLAAGMALIARIALLGFRVESGFKL